MRSITKIGLISFLSIISLEAYDIEKEGDWWYMYDGSYIVGAYSKTYFKKYRVVCGSPSVSETKNKYYDSSYNMNMMKDAPTKRESQNRIKKYCKKRQ